MSVNVRLQPIVSPSQTRVGGATEVKTDIICSWRGTIRIVSKRQQIKKV